VAVKILENLAENMEEAEEELFVLQKLSIHPNLPSFHGIYFKRNPRIEDSQLWYVMEVSDENIIFPATQTIQQLSTVVIHP